MMDGGASTRIMVFGPFSFKKYSFIHDPTDRKQEFIVLPYQAHETETQVKTF